MTELGPTQEWPTACTDPGCPDASRRHFHTSPLFTAHDQVHLTRGGLVSGGSEVRTVPGETITPLRGQLDVARIVATAAQLEAAIAYLPKDTLDALRRDHPDVLRAWGRLQSALGGRL